MNRKEIFSRDGYICQICGKPVRSYGFEQIAHCIKQGKGSEDYVMQFIWNEYRKDRSRKWVKDNIINHPDNLKSVCSLRCNDRCNIFNKPVERDILLQKIIKKVINN